jgi:hypothetical protein
MQQRSTLMSQAQTLQKQGIGLTSSARCVTIHLVHVKPGKARREYLLQDFWEDEDFRWGCESGWAKDGFRVNQVVYF